MSSSQPLESTGRTAATEQEHTHTGILSVFANHIYPLCSPSFSAPLFPSKQVFSLMPHCAVCSYRHPRSQHVFGPLLSWPSQSPPWPTNTLTSPDPQRNFHRKTTQEQNPTTVLLPENHCIAENSKQERTSSGDKEVWFIYNTTFVPSGQTGKWRQQ